MVPSPTVGSAWGCWSCGAPGLLLDTACPHCHAELSPVLLAARRTGVAHYNDGLAAALGGFWSEAAESLERALELAGPDPGVLGLLGLVYQRAGRVAEALAVWAQAGQSGPHVAWAEAVRTATETGSDLAILHAYNEALALAQDGRWSEALNALAVATAPESRLSQAFVVKGMAAWSAGQLDEAEAAWQRAIDLDPSAPGLQTCLVALVESKAAQARQSVVAAAVQAPALAPTMPRERSTAHILVAVLGALTLLTTVSTAVMSRRATVARFDATRATDDAARSARLLEETKDSLAQSEGAVAKAKEALAKAESELKQVTEREAAALQVLQAAQPSGRAQDAEALLAALADARRLGVTVPAWVEGSLEQSRLKAAIDRYFEGYLAFMADDYSRAAAAFAAALKLETNVYVADDAAYLGARSTDLSGDAAEAVKWYERVVTDFPGSDYQDDALFFGARAAARAGDRTKAVRLYRELLAKFPGSGYDHDANAALTELGG